MPIALTDIEQRILGSLIEKSLTTPAQYPLSLNSLMLACNQKSSRDPVMSLDESTVARGLASLQQKNLVYQKSESGNRTPKFGHRSENLMQGGNAKEIGALCVLFLRGPQTPGEIKTRTDRLCEYENSAEVEMVLNELATRTDGPFVARMPRQSGQKETRFQHLFSDAVSAAQEPPKIIRPSSAKPDAEDRLAQLEKRVENLERIFQTQSDRTNRQ